MVTLHNAAAEEEVTSCRITSHVHYIHSYTWIMGYDALSSFDTYNLKSLVEFQNNFSGKNVSLLLYKYLQNKI